MIPCYNCETTVVETVLSIRDSHEQVMRDKELPSQWEKMEVVCVNDGSTDATPDILDVMAIEHPNIKVVHLKENMGKGYARNAGNLAASADIIAVLDADDWNIADRTATVLKTFHENPKKDVFYSGFVTRHIELNHNEPFRASPIDLENLRLRGEFNICHSTVAYRKKTILENKYSESRNHDDWMMLWSFFSKGYKFCHSPKILVAYRADKETVNKESVPGKQDRILEKKKKIMESYFKEVASGIN